jgi:hypothetical protein
MNSEHLTAKAKPRGKREAFQEELTMADLK